MLATDFEKAEIDNTIVHYIEVGVTKKGEIHKDNYHYFILNCKNEEIDGKNLVFKLEKVKGDSLLFISQENKKPNLLNNKWNQNNSSSDSIVIPYDQKRFKSTIFYISVLAFKVDSSFSLSVKVEEKENSNQKVVGTLSPSQNPNYQKCLTCRHLIPTSSFATHSIFCSRNNFYCEKCDLVLQVSAKNSHLHCSFCEKGFNDPQDLEKHTQIFHTEINCECGESFSLDALKDHKLFKCPKRKVRCANCELEYFFNEKHLCNAIKKFQNCSFCGKSISLTDLDDHLEQHEKMGK